MAWHSGRLRFRRRPSAACRCPHTSTATCLDLMTPRPTKTVEEVSAPLEHYLVPVPPAGDGVCVVCHEAVYDGYRTCYRCNEAMSVFGEFCLNAVSFVSLA